LAPFKEKNPESEHFGGTIEEKKIGGRPILAAPYLFLFIYFLYFFFSPFFN